MKYQVILESNKNMADDDFERFVSRSLKQWKMPNFKLIGARSLEGIRAEIWQPARREKDPLE